MKAGGHLLAHICGMIDALEVKIETGTLTPALLAAVQKKLDAIDTAHRNSPQFVHSYPRMLELQTLIHGESGKEQEALKYLKEAVRESGGVTKLHSKLLRDYIAEHAPAQTGKNVEAAAANQSVTEQVLAKKKARHAKKLHLRLKPSRKLRILTATALGLVVLAVGAVRFVPQVAALPNIVAKHSQISNAKQAYDKLSAEYKNCSTKLAGERNTVDTNNMQAFTQYNQEVASCQAVLQQQHKAADTYNNLVGVQ